MIGLVSRTELVVWGGLKGLVSRTELVVWEGLKGLVSRTGLVLRAAKQFTFTSSQCLSEEGGSDAVLPKPSPLYVSPSAHLCLLLCLFFKKLLLLEYCCFIYNCHIYFWPQCIARWVLVPRPGIEPVPLQWKGLRLRSARQVPFLRVCEALELCCLVFRRGACSRRHCLCHTATVCIIYEVLFSRAILVFK